jgi:hypothetical protein
VTEKKDNISTFLAVKGRPKMTEKKAFNLLLPPRLAEAVDGQCVGVRNTIFAVLIAKGLESYQRESISKNQTITVDADELLKELEYLP